MEALKEENRSLLEETTGACLMMYMHVYICMCVCWCVGVYNMYIAFVQNPPIDSTPPTLFHPKPPQRCSRSCRACSRTASSSAATSTSGTPSRYCTHELIGWLVVVSYIYVCIPNQIKPTNPAHRPVLLPPHPRPKHQSNLNQTNPNPNL